MPIVQKQNAYCSNCEVNFSAQYLHTNESIEQSDDAKQWVNDEMHTNIVQKQNAYGPSRTKLAQCK